MSTVPPVTGDQAISSFLKEERSFPPPAAFQSRAAINSLAEYDRLWQFAAEQPERFWAQQAETLLSWTRRWDRVLDWQLPHAKWFTGAKLNVSYNCVDRHLQTWRKNKAAIIWEAESGETRVLTYNDLHREVSRCASALKDLGIKPCDRVTIYMPLVPELAIAMLACARIGATHNVVFGGFSAEAIAERNSDAQAKLVITADGGFRRGAVVPLKHNVDQALLKSPTVEKVLVLRRTGEPVPMTTGRDYWWHEILAKASPHCEPVAVDSEHPLFLLYTSGSTGKPKGIMHTTAGYLLHATLTSKWIFDLKDEDTYWCTADLGWVTGHSYVVYGPLANGATTLMYEGAPNHPDWGRFWQIVERHKVSILYTAPTAIRAFARQGAQIPGQYDLRSLRLLGTVGEPINPEAWMWYRDVIGGGRCPVVDTWWQTETGGIMIAPLPGAVATVPGSATRPFFGVVPDVVDMHGKSVPDDQGGFLVIKKPWPGMLRTIWGDDERFKKQYWSQIPGYYFTGDGARRDTNGYYWIMGRIDDVLNVSGHRLSTMEIESALVSHQAVAEAAVVGAPHDLKGEAVHAFVTLEAKIKPSASLKAELSEHVVKQIGALARPESIHFAESLPKTRSGKIMRRLLRDIAAGRESSGDTTTLEDYSVLAKLRETDEV